MTDLPTYNLHDRRYLFIMCTLCVFRLELMEIFNIEYFLTDCHARSDIAYKLQDLDKNLHTLDNTGKTRNSKQKFQTRRKCLFTPFLAHLSTKCSD